MSDARPPREWRFYLDDFYGFVVSALFGESGG